MKTQLPSLWTHGVSRQPRKGARNIAYLAVLLLLCSTSPVFAQSEASEYAGDEISITHPTRSYLFGDWGGKRGELASRGITFDFFYVADLQANPVGGVRQAEAGWGRIRGTVDIDF
jgi:carbohydrate-selective porin OprB